MIEAGDLKTGVTLKLDNNIFRVVKTAYNKPGRGKASMNTTLMDLRTGNTVQRVFGAEERLDNIFIEAEKVDYLYRDGNFLYFMNPESYEQYEATAELFAAAKKEGRVGEAQVLFSQPRAGALKDAGRSRSQAVSAGRRTHWAAGF